MKKTLEQQIRQVMAGEALEYGTDKARDTYAKDTPGQTPGLEHDPIQHQHKSSLALDGVPKEGGELTKPNFEKDAGLGKVAEAKEMKVKNCGCGQDPCETYGSKEEQMKEELKKDEITGKMRVKGPSHVSAADINNASKKYAVKPIPGNPKYKGKQGDPEFKNEENELDEAGRWDQSSQGRAYRRLSPEEKARMAKKNAVKKAAARMKGKTSSGKQGIGKLKSVYKGTTKTISAGMGEADLDSLLDHLNEKYVTTLEAMSDAERKVAAGKIFRMHQAKLAAKSKPTDPGAKAAKRDSAGYKTSDDSHLDAKPKPEPKRGRGERDLPHITHQMRGIIDVKGKNHSGVKFKDGSTQKVSYDHAKKYMAKHDSSKPADKLKMYQAHDNHKSFMKHVGEDVEAVNELSGKTLSNYIQKSANPVKKNSAVNLASRGGFKLGQAGTHDIDAGEKEDKKAYNRGQGMQRAAIKLQKKMYGKKTNEAVNSKDTEGLKKLSKDLTGSMKAHNKQKKELDKLIQDESYDPVMEAMKRVYGESAFDTNSWPTYKDHRQKTADRKTADSLNSPKTLKKRQQMHPAHRKAYDAKVRQNNYDKHGVGSKQETTPLDKKLHHPDVKAP